MKSFHIANVVLILAVLLAFTSCEKEGKPSVIVTNFVASVAENPPNNMYLGQVQISMINAENANFYFTGTEVLNSNISMNSQSGEIFITNPAFFDYELRTSATTNAAVEVFNAKDEMAVAYFTITINITDVLEAAPSLTTAAITQITASSAISGGSIVNNGNSDIVERGIVWSSTNFEPTINDSKVVVTSETSSFTGMLTSLASNTTYYVRSYATNSIGTGYGNVLVFTTLLAIGDSHQGGIVAYILQPGNAGYDANVQHGIIAATEDQSTSAPWAITLTATGATGQAVGTGQSNTNTIVSNQGDGVYAAKICDELVFGGYSDWYLPSMWELEQLYINKNLIGGFAVAFYWSSTEDGTNTAWLQSFNSNSQTAGAKTNTYYVRAVRSF